MEWTPSPSNFQVFCAFLYTVSPLRRFDLPEPLIIRHSGIFMCFRIKKPILSNPLINVLLNNLDLYATHLARWTLPYFDNPRLKNRVLLSDSMAVLRQWLHMYSAGAWSLETPPIYWWVTKNSLAITWSLEQGGQNDQHGWLSTSMWLCHVL